jgi:hypothetical protein
MSGGRGEMKSPFPAETIADWRRAIGPSAGRLLRAILLSVTPNAAGYNWARGVRV